MDIEDYEDIMTVISATFEGCAKACQESVDCIIWEFDATGAVDGEGQCMLWSIECPGDLMMTGGGWNRHACEIRDPEGKIQNLNLKFYSHHSLGKLLRIPQKSRLLQSLYPHNLRCPCICAIDWRE